MELKSSGTKVIHKTVSILKVLALLCFCTLFAAAVTCPLYFLASTASHFYTTAVLFLMAVFSGYFIYKKIRTDGFIHVLKALLLILITASGLFLTFHLVMKGYRFPGILILILTPVSFFLVYRFFKVK